MNRQQIARQRRRPEHALQARNNQPLVDPRPVGRHQVHDGLHRVVAGNHFRQVVHGPHLRIVVNARDVLVTGDFVDRERRRIAQQLARRRQVLPKRHFHLAPAPLHQGIELRRMFHDSALSEVGQFRRPFDCILLELRRNDNVRNPSLCHDLPFSFVLLFTPFAPFVLLVPLVS